MSDHIRALLTSEAQAELPEIADEFERQGADAEVVIFGREGHGQGVMVPWDMWMEILPYIEDYLDLRLARQRIKRGGPSLGPKEGLRAAGIDDPDEFIRSCGLDPDDPVFE